MDLLQTGSLDLLLVRQFATALLIGALIGVDRQKSRASGPGQFAGLRTFILVALSGAMSAWLATSLQSPVLVVVGLAAVGGLMAVAYAAEARRATEGEGHGLTTEVAALVTYLLGVAALTGHEAVAVMLAICTSAILTFRQGLHRAAEALGHEDLAAVLKLLFAAFVVLPLLPDRPMDPWQVLNPTKLWWLVILISALSLIGYVAVRVLGARRGLALTGFFGGLVSSTAVTLSFARLSKEEGQRPETTTIGVLLAWTVMLVRIVILVLVVHPPLVRLITPPLAGMLVVSLVALAIFWRSGGSGPDTSGMELKNPFSLTAAVKFGAGFAAILLVVQLARNWLGEGWIVGVAALAGATDVDAITLSMAEGARSGLTPGVAALAILVAAWVNTGVKAGIALTTGHRGMSLRLLAVAGASTVVGVAITVVTLGLPG